MPLIDIGQPAPPFSLPDAQGVPHALGDAAGRPVVVFFYPKDDTPGCTKEACAFRDLRPRFDDQDVTIFGVSPDDAASHARFVSKFDLNFTLLADVPGAEGTPPVCDAWGVWGECEWSGKRFMGVRRTTYLVGADGCVARRWDQVDVDGHAEAVLQAVSEL